ncbi:MAG: HAMP domain-containing protein [Micromonosporaceae bacterium]|nr:HAMP domain-containing protein [Micromonosporaceae bacterium]
MAWWRRLSLRTRLTAIGTAGLAVGLALGGLLLMAALQFTLQRTMDESALRTATDVAALVDAGQVPDPLLTGQGGVVVQVIDSGGRVKAASPGADRLVGVLRPSELRKARAGERFYVPGERAGVAGKLRVVAVAAGPGWDRQTVVVATPAHAHHDAVRFMRSTLWVVFPALLATLAALLWGAVGWTLRPVEALRRGAAEITAAPQESGSLPVPDAEDEVHRLAVTLNDMLARLAAARARQRAFVADAAHELRSPLASMRTQLEVAQRHQPEDWPAFTDDLLADTERLGRLVDDLLLLAQADDAGVQAATDPVDLRGVVETVAERHAGARVTVAVRPGEEVRAAGDERHLDRVVSNLVENAARHAASAVTIAVSHADGAAVVTVSDDGPGIPAEDRERVFDRFTRLDNARARDAGGAGLGLAIVRELVRLHGGSVQLRDADGDAGLTAEIRLRAL